MPFRQKYVPNISTRAVRGWCLKYIDDAGAAPTRRPTAQVAANAEAAAGRLRRDTWPTEIWIVIFLSLNTGAYKGLGHVAFAKQYANGRVEIHDSEVHAGARSAYSSLPELLAWFGAHRPSYIGWSTQCDGRQYVEEYREQKSVDAIAREVIQGKWGNGQYRTNALQASGYNAAAVQARVNEILTGGTSTKRPNSEIAREVIQGKWGNGATRQARLAAAGYNYAAIQAEVNRLLQ